MKPINLFYKYLFLRALLLLNFTAAAATDATFWFSAFRKLNCRGTILYIAAHPDDENNTLLSALSSEYQMRTAYLSLSRGEGGQNLIGSEQGTELGLLRTSELLEARAIDGAEQYFSRAYDFGYSRNPEETLRLWNPDSLLSDIVQLIRLLQPQIIICRFPTTGEGGHGHHTASAILSQQAFTLAAQANYKPELGTPWKCKQLLWNAFFRDSTPSILPAGYFSIPVGNYNPVTGKNPGETGAESRSRHQCQAMGTAASRSPQREYFRVLAGDSSNLISSTPANRMEWKSKVENIQNQFQAEHPDLTFPELKNLIQQLPQIEYFSPAEKTYLNKLLQKMILASAGWYASAHATQNHVCPGDTLSLNCEWVVRTPLRSKLLSVEANGKKLSQTDTLCPIPLIRSFRIPAAELSAPFTSLPANNITQNLYSGSTHYLMPLNREISLNAKIQIENLVMDVPVPIRYYKLDRRFGEIESPLHFLPAVSVSFENTVLFADTSNRLEATVKITAFSSIKNADLCLIVPNHWKIDPPKLSIPALEKDRSATLQFSLRLPQTFRSGDSLGLLCTIASDTFTHTIKTINYPHIQEGVHSERAVCRLIRMQNFQKLTIGYINGSGDKLPALLSRMGHRLRTISTGLWNADSLKNFDLIITGIRAFNTNAELAQNYPLLLAYLKNGGTLIEQYNTDYGLLQKPGPLPLQLSTQRVTDENALMSPTADAAQILPGLSPDWFKDWIQERGLYFPANPDPAYRKPLSTHDPGLQPDSSALLFLPHGQGKYWYCSLSLFRQLPAGVPGAYQLLDAMMSNNMR